MNSMNDAAATYISVAKVACELFTARDIAEELSIISKNARALAVRAGSTAAGFNEITKFIEGLSKLTIEAAGSVNRVAIEQTKKSSDLYRVDGFIRRLDAVNLEDSLESEDALKDAYERALERKQGLEREVKRRLKELRERLEETKLELRATQVVSVVSRVEASRADEAFQMSLNSVADKVADAGERINGHLDKARSYLAQLR